MPKYSPTYQDGNTRFDKSGQFIKKLNAKDTHSEASENKLHLVYSILAGFFTGLMLFYLTEYFFKRSDSLSRLLKKS